MTGAKMQHYHSTHGACVLDVREMDTVREKLKTGEWKEQSLENI